MFSRLFGGGRTPPPESYALGQRLFQEGMQAAVEYRTADALVLYTRSFEVNPNPAPLINRAKIYRLRLLFDEAIRDLESALRLDKQQGDEFSITLANELRECKLLAEIRSSGRRGEFIADLRSKGFSHVAGSLADSVFKGDGQLLGYHMVDEIDNIKKFENLSDFPAVKILTANWMKDQAVIDQVLSDSSLREEYGDRRPVFEAMLGVYDYPDMAKLRDKIVGKIWCLLNPPGAMQSLWETSLRRMSE